MSWTRSNVLGVVKAEKANIHAEAGYPVSLISGDIGIPISAQDDAGENARAIIEELRAQSVGYIAITEARARAAIGREAQRHTANWVASVKAGTQIDVSRLLADDDLVQVLSVKSEEFAALVRNVSDDIVYRINRETLTSIFEGKSNAEVAKALRQIEDIGRKRAKLIARDQASKLNAAMNELRQEQAGVTHYRWKTILDGRESASNHARNNQIHRWDKPPPGTGHPGHEINCRCRALAVLDEYPDDVSTASEPPPSEEEIDVPTLPALPAGDIQRRALSKPRPLADAVEEGRQFVLSQGSKTGHEWGLAHDDVGRRLSIHSSAAAQRVELSSDVIPEAYRDPPRVIFHHNHPSDTSFSQADVAAFEGLRGLSELYAHGAAGSTYRMEVVAVSREGVGRAAKIAEGRVQRFLKQAVSRRKVSLDDAQRAYPHLRMLVLSEQGVVRYRYDLSPTMAAVMERNKDVFDRIVGDATHFPLDRSPQPIRHYERLAGASG